MDKQKKTLFKQFVENKYNNYVEPERKGTPRGETIGMKKGKYFASLLMLGDFNWKEIAKEHNFDHKVVLKWRTEPAFKNQIKENINQFIDEIDNFVQSKVEGIFYSLEGKNDPEQIDKETDKEVANLKKDFDSFFADIGLYGFELVEGILSYIYNKFKIFLKERSDYNLYYESILNNLKSKIITMKDLKSQKQKNLLLRIQIRDLELEREFWKETTYFLSDAIKEARIKECKGLIKALIERREKELEGLTIEREYEKSDKVKE